MPLGWVGMNISNQRRRQIVPTSGISLVLGSGGARGLAHIGVIRALCEDSRFRINSITGSSIGALIGGLHAVGKLDAYAEWVCGLTRGDVWRLLDFSFTRDGLFEGEKLMGKLDEMIGDVCIENLPLPFVAVASDIHRRQEVWLNRGPLSKAIRASIAIPGVFTPVDFDGRLLVDGGLLSPLPLAPAQYQANSQTVAVSLNGLVLGATRGGSTEEEAGIGFAQPSGALQRWVRRGREALGIRTGATRSDAFAIIARSLQAMQDRIAGFQVAAYPPGILIEIPADACGVLDFHLAGKMIALGHRQALATLAEAGALPGTDTATQTRA